MERDWGTRHPDWNGISSSIVEVAGTPVHVLRADGPTDGPTQLLVHGLGGAAVNWLDVIGPLSARGPVLVPDLPGFGRTQPPRARASRIPHNLAFLRALIRTCGITRAEVHGNSMGGMLATLLAADDDRFIERLVLVAPGLPGPTGRLHEIDPLTIRTFAPLVVPGFGERRMRRWYDEHTAEELIEENQSYMHADPSRVRPELTAALVENAAYGKRNPWRVESFAAAGNSLVAHLAGRRELNAAIDAIGVPTLMVWGERDRLIGRPVIEQTMARRPDWDLVELPDTGHAPMIEDPTRYVATITDWLDGPRAEVA